MLRNIKTALLSIEVWSQDTNSALFVLSRHTSFFSSPLFSLVKLLGSVLEIVSHCGQEVPPQSPTNAAKRGY